MYSGGPPVIHPYASAANQECMIAAQGKQVVPFLGVISSVLARFWKPSND
jgi:hypothetical protein